MEKETFNGAIGIDLGTTYSCVGIWRGNNVEIIANDQGCRTTPSYVAFTQSERLVGDAAKNQATMNSSNTIFDAKRLIGRNFSDTVIQQDLNHWPFAVINKDDKPYFGVKYLGEEKIFTPEEISAMILNKLKETAEGFLGQKVSKAVITVPAYFNDSQRQSTKDAGTIAGLQVIRIINEPTAAALAYGLSNNCKKEKNVLIFDFGGGTHDVSLLAIDDGVYEVKATGGDTHLGGEDIDNILVDYFDGEFFKKTGKTIKTNKKATIRLRNACERAKRNLSAATSTSIEIDSLIDGIDFYTSITRAKFEDLCKPIFDRTLKPVEQVLLDSKICKSDVDEIVLVGGSTRIPKIQNLLSEYFNGKPVNKSINPDEAVAYGAAVQAAILTGTHDSQLEHNIILDVIPLSLGIETAGSRMTVLLPRNSTVPCHKSDLFSTYHDNQTQCQIRVFEGERLLTTDCNLLGEFTLTGIPAMPRGTPQIEVSYDVDCNGILNVTAVEKSSGVSKKVKIENTDRLSKDQIDQMVQDAKQFADEDNKMKDRIDSRNKLEQFVYGIQNSLTDEFKNKISPDNLSLLTKYLTDINDWLTTHHNEEKSEYETKFEELQAMMTTIYQSDVTAQQSGPTVEDID